MGRVLEIPAKAAFQSGRAQCSLKGGEGSRTEVKDGACWRRALGRGQGRGQEAGAVAGLWPSAPAALAPWSGEEVSDVHGH